MGSQISAPSDQGIVTVQEGHTSEQGVRDSVLCDDHPLLTRLLALRQRVPPPPSPQDIAAHEFALAHHIRQGNPLFPTHCPSLYHPRCMLGVYLILQWRTQALASLLPVDAEAEGSAGELHEAIASYVAWHKGRAADVANRQNLLLQKAERADKYALAIAEQTRR